DVEAGASKERVFFDNDGLQSKFAGSDGRYIPPWTAADDRYVVLCHYANLPSGDFSIDGFAEIATNRRRPTRRERLCTRKQQSLAVARRGGNLTCHGRIWSLSARGAWACNDPRGRFRAS